MVNVSKVNDIVTVKAKTSNNNAKFFVNSVGTNGVSGVKNEVTNENIVDIGNLYNEGNGINIENRTISVDSTVVALKSDLTVFLTSHQDISGKADKATTLSGYGILDGLSYEIVEDEEEE